MAASYLTTWCSDVWQKEQHRCSSVAIGEVMGALVMDQAVRGAEVLLECLGKEPCMGCSHASCAAGLSSGWRAAT